MLKTNITVGNKKISCLVDTGASRSLLSDSELLPGQKSPDTLLITGYDGILADAPLTKPLKVKVGNHMFLSRFLVSRGAPTNLLGADILQKIGANITYHPDGTVTLAIGDNQEHMEMCNLIQYLEEESELSGTPPSDLDQILSSLPGELWEKHPADVGLLPIPPVTLQLIPGAVLPQQKQYPLSAPQETAIEMQVQSFLKSGVLKEVKSPANTPLYPVKKKSVAGSPVKYRMVQDLRAVNKILAPMTPLVPNPHTLLSQIPSTSMYFTVIDLANAFFSVPLAEECQLWFAFSIKNRQLTWTRLPQGMAHSPTLYSQALQTVLGEWVPPDSCVLLQYVDDLLLCCPDKETCLDTTLNLLRFLAEKG